MLTCLTVGSAVGEPGREPAGGGAIEAVWPKSSTQATRLDGGTVVSFEEGSVVERLPDKVVTSGARGKTRTYVFKLEKGRIEIDIDKSAKNTTAVLVMAPQGLSGAVLGGRGIVKADAEGVSFTAQRFSMLIALGAHSKQLAEGKTLAVDAQGGFHQLGLPPKPEIFLEQGLALAMPGAGFEATVRFKPSEAVSSYQVALLKKTGDSWARAQSHKTNGNHITLQGREAGNYAVVARAFNRFGIESEVSAAVPLRVVGVRLPSGARATEAGIFIGQSEHVELVAVDGLKASYGHSAYAVDAPRSLSLGRSKHALVSLLDPSTESKLYLQLYSQSTSARISLGSPTATWPRDSIVANVTLVDGAGRPLPSSKGYSAEVSVNLKPLALAWKTNKNVMRALIPTPSGVPGPWVIRVAVKNAKGEVVGHDFLEVAKSPATAN